MSRLSLCVAVFLASLSHAAAPPTDPRPAQVRYHFRVLSGDPFGTFELLSRPTMTTLDGQMGQVAVGQTVRVGGEDENIGIVFGVTPAILPGGKVRVELTAKVSARVEETEPDARIRTDKVTAVRTMTFGVAQRVRVSGSGGKTTWIEVIADRPDAPEPSEDWYRQDVAKPARPAQ